LRAAFGQFGVVAGMLIRRTKLGCLRDWDYLVEFSFQDLICNLLRLLPQTGPIKL
jgi:hypothetical protein